jgi:hypothetical protein
LLVAAQVLVYREGGNCTVLIARCAHQSGPLGEGKTTEVDRPGRWVEVHPDAAVVGAVGELLLRCSQPGEMHHRFGGEATTPLM